MQLNFLQEDLLELIQQEHKKPAPAVALQNKPAQASLLPDLPQVASKKPKPSGVKPAAMKPLAEQVASDIAEEKSPAAFKTISEAADILGVPAYVLRFWESQFPQINPTKSRGGRRYYRPEDMEVLTTIKTLLYKQGYTIKGARKAFSQLKDDVLAEHAVPVQMAPNAKPVITPRQRTQLSTIRSELLSLKEQLLPYLAD